MKGRKKADKKKVGAVSRPKHPTKIERSSSEIPPGEWAEYLLAFDPSLLRETSSILRQQTPKRELQARLYDAETLDRRLIANHTNLESALAQIMGDLASVPCTRCAKGHGPWTSCVVVPDLLMGSCAGCFFNKQGSTCSFREPTKKSTTKPLGDGLMTASAQHQETGRRWLRSSDDNVSSKRSARLEQPNVPRSRIPVPSPRSNTPPNFRPPTHDDSTEEAEPERQDESLYAPVSDIDWVAMGGDQQWDFMDSFRDLRCHLRNIVVRMDAAINDNNSALIRTEQGLSFVLESLGALRASGQRLQELQNGLIQVEAHLDELEQAVNED